MKKFFSFFVCAFLFVSFSNRADAQTPVDSVKSLTVKVEKLTCNGDMPTIKKQLLNQEGIDEVTFTPRAEGASVFTILYHNTVTDRQKIEKVIESTPGCDDKSTTPYRVSKEKSQKKNQ